MIPGAHYFRDDFASQRSNIGRFNSRNKKNLICHYNNAGTDKFIKNNGLSEAKSTKTKKLAAILASAAALGAGIIAFKKSPKLKNLISDFGKKIFKKDLKTAPKASEGVKSKFNSAADFFKKAFGKTAKK